MATIRFSAADLPRELRTDLTRAAEQIKAGVRIGLQRGRTHLARQTPVDTGVHRAAWRVRPGRDGHTLGELVNDAPMIGVLERGARPHPVSREGIEAIAAWCRRKFAVDEKTSISIAYAIARKIRQHGQRGLFFVRNSTPQIQAWVVAEVRRLLMRHRGGGGAR
jgi:hypothetical protein